MTTADHEDQRQSVHVRETHEIIVEVAHGFEVDVKLTGRWSAPQLLICRNSVWKDNRSVCSGVVGQNHRIDDCWQLVPCYAQCGRIARAISPFAKAIGY